MIFGQTREIIHIKTLRIHSKSKTIGRTSAFRMYDSEPYVSHPVEDTGKGRPHSDVNLIKEYNGVGDEELKTSNKINGGGSSCYLT